MSQTRSQFYNSLLGETKNKFDHNRHKRTQSITENSFFNWTSGHMYRTSYNDMANRFKSCERKNHVLPGYQGFRPKIAADSLLQKRFTEQSRDVFHNQALDDGENKMASTGFNKTHIPRTDDTLNATSRRYGTRTEPFTHPNNHAKYAPNETTFRASFINPKRHPSQVFRNRDPSREFSNDVTRKFHEHVQDKQNLNGPRQALNNNCSGYTMNSTLWDGTSWATERNFHTDQTRTQYRKQFNQPKPFHKRDIKESPSRVPRKLITYEPADMKVSGFGGNSLNLKRFEENGKARFIDA